MRKSIKIIFGALFALAVALFSFLPAWQSVSMGAKASFDEDIILIGSDIQEVPAGTVGTGVEIITNYAPINKSTGSRVGNALKFKTSISLPFDFSSFQLKTQDNCSVFLWIYLSDRNFEKITVSFRGSSYSINWELLKTDILTQNEQEPITIAPGWKKIELPFEVASVLHGGEETNASIDFNQFNTLFVSVSENYDSMIFDARISNSGSNSINVLESEPYSSFKLSSAYNNIKAGVLKGDRIVTPSFSNLVADSSYIWVGNNRITAESGTINGFYYFNDSFNKTWVDQNVQYKLYMKVSSDNSTDVKYYALNNKSSSDTYSQNGTYYVQLVVQATIEDKSYYIAAADKLEISIADYSSAIWFDLSTQTLDAGLVYRIDFHVSSEYWRIAESDLEVTTSDAKVLEVVDIRYYGNGNGYVEVKGLKKGKAKLEMSGEFTKVNGQSRQVFSSDIDFSVSAKSSGSNVMNIVLWCVLGTGLAGAVAYGIYAIVKHNKMQIK